MGGLVKMEGRIEGRGGFLALELRGGEDWADETN
jgi:hypothetical protein